MGADGTGGADRHDFPSSPTNRLLQQLPFGILV
jgi:hypothetical protein